MDDTQAIHGKLDRAAALIYARDPAIVDELWSDGFRLVGSEEGEIAASREDLEQLVTALFGASFRLRWNWGADERPVGVEGDTAWVFAQGQLEFVYDDGTVKGAAYRLVAIFHRAGGDWKWRLYSGSEPAPPRDLHS